ncbi:MAG TPA: hypothetical protein VKD90_29115 [Gemmataceae bacterium]|nr:hypothetical protein [Gemmataceae bacterium]
MPVPRQLLQAAFAALPEATLRAAAEHNDIRGRDAMTAAELAERLGRGDGTHLVSYAWHMPAADLKVVAAVFGIPAGRRPKDDLRFAVQNFVNSYDYHRAREKARRQAAGLQAMSGQELLAEGAKLRQPVVHLAPGRGPRMAVWTAERDRRARGLRPWIAVDLRQHPDDKVRRAGVLELHVDDAELMGHAEFRPGRLPAARPGEKSLAGTDAWDMPSLEIVFRKGSRAVQTWLDQMKKEGWDLRAWAGDVKFPLQDALDGYRKGWQTAHPLYHEGVYAQLGGWPLTWPEEADVEQLGRRLVLRTYRSSEPWVEVWRKGRGYEVSLRIT